MKHKLLLILLAASMSQSSAFANDADIRTKPVQGLGIGALIGGIVAGPPGLLIGAAIGSSIGEHESKKDTITALEDELADKDKEFKNIAAEITRLNSEHKKTLQKVTLDRIHKEMESLSNRVSLSVFFRTDSDVIESHFYNSISNLVSLIEKHPEINVHINAYSDIRGSGHYNFDLSQRRAQSVAKKLIQHGLDENRIQIHAFGEHDSSELNDLDSFVFDRRVDITLTLLDEV